MTKTPGDAARFADPDEIVRAREAAGWSRDQLADAAGALPVEVAAWESGTIRLRPHEAEVVRWKIAWTLHEQAHRPPSGCGWMTRHRDRLNLYRQTSASLASRAERAMAEHRKTCDICQTAYDPDARSAPLPPPARGVRGWFERAARVVERLPTWLRVPVKLASALTFAAGTGALWHLLELLANPSKSWSYPGPGARWGMLFGCWSALVVRLFRPLGRRYPRLMGQVCAAAIVLPTAFIWSDFGQEFAVAPWMWLFVMALGTVPGILISGYYTIEGEFDERDPVPSP
ncbi:helix-turn-helix transcriptional regulator [Longimicrobium sp.]|uniref:helix-turn-helix domain-containing protein n=1 Tax=Longimicrobium sp. TaxID=2029185 RepID=UPI002E357121|nr:helix-turn-helix transcriptional regulator [Longimicrobium sp.]HEX6040723.1 helix-turn-helix transcriptional regulator [Longimicrobium sp.]